MNRLYPIAVILVVAAVGFAACGDDDAAATTATEAPTTTEAPAVVQTTGAPATTTAPATTADPDAGFGEEWTPEFIDSFMGGCLAEGTEAQCQCMLDEFQSRYTLDVFAAWAFEAADDDPRLVEVLDICTP